MHQLAFDRFDRSAHSLVGKWQESRERHPEQARVESIRSVILGKGFLVRAESARANFGMNLIANLPPPTDMFRSRASASLHQFNSTIKSHPRHHFGMGEMFGAAAHFPNSLVRLVPIRFKKIHQGGLQAPIGLAVFDSGLVRPIHRAQHFAIDIELKLTGGSVANAHRF